MILKESETGTNMPDTAEDTDPIHCTGAEYAELKQKKCMSMTVNAASDAGKEEKDAGNKRKG